jgi:hypothetical protein
MPVFGQHVDFIAELFQQFFVNFGVEILFYSHLQSFVYTFVDGTKTSLGDLRADLQVGKVDFKDGVGIELKRVFAVGAVFLHRHFIKLFLQLLDTFLLCFVLTFHLNNSAKGFSIIHGFFRIEPRRCLDEGKKVL